ncbi:myocardin-related transcription factor A isoform X2 [Eleutherodactylus coqui]
MHILEETSAEPSLQAKQLKLKRARLADDLNEKISQRPGPIELVVKNIFPVETSLKEAIIDVNYAKMADSSSSDEDSGDTLSPEQPASRDSQGSVPVSADSKHIDVPLLPTTQTLTSLQLGSEHARKNIASGLLQSTNVNSKNGFPVPPNKSFPVIVKQNHTKTFHEKFRAKKIKNTKLKMKKLKYHQYVSPDQRLKGSPTMNSSYAKILQQQQLFLQLQIINHQQQNYNYQTILPAPPKLLHDQPNAAVTTTMEGALPAVSISTHCAPIGFKQNNSKPTTATKTGPLPSNLEDLKVPELKQELKQRGLHVSGTKVDLIERLKATQDLCTVTTYLKPASIQQSKPCEVISVIPNVYTPSSILDPLSLCGFSSSAPCSPCPSEISKASAENVHTAGDSSAETVSSVTHLLFLQSPASVTGSSPTDVRYRDIMLQEKDRQIEELTRRLKQKQELVERLKEQLEYEKRTQQPQPSDDHLTLIVQVKQEIGQVTCDSSRCTETSNTTATVKREPTSLHKANLFLSSVSKRDEMKISRSSETQLVFTVNQRNTLNVEDNKSVILQDEQPTEIKANNCLDNFIHNFYRSTEYKESRIPNVKQTPTHPVVNEVLQNELLRLQSPNAPDRLEDFLESSTGTKILQWDEDDTLSMPLIDELHSQMLSSLAILDHPTSFMDTTDLHFTPEGNPLGLDISEPHLDNKDWLGLLEPPAMNLTPLSTTTPSVFSTDFFDSYDLQLQWDTGL